MAEPVLRIAFVVQRYGAEVNGGAELHCRWVAEHMSQYAEVHVFTTCAQSYTKWQNVYCPGERLLNGVHVHRYTVDRTRRPRRFARLTRSVLTEPHTYLDELHWMREQGPISASLLSAIAARRDSFDVFIFFTYLYATTYYGLQLVPERAMLVPTAHDEPTLYLDLFRPVFHLPRSILYNTHEEQRLVQRVFHNQEVPSAIVGTGIELPSGVDAARFRKKYGIEGDFVLYIGRLAPSKNVAELVAYHRRFLEERGKQAMLVLLGKGEIRIPQGPLLQPLGFVSEADKFAALAASAVVIVPSRYESLSMVVLEAWMMGKPVLVNGACEVLREQCLRGKGGLYYESYAEFSLALHTLMSNPALRDALGRSGQDFAQREYSWDTVERKYLRSIADYLEDSKSA